MQKISITKSDKIEHIAVDKIGSVLFNIRSQRKVQEDLESEEFEQLKLSIEKEGISQPIVLAPNKNGTYSIVDGSRRLEAVRQLGHKEIRALVLDGSSETQFVITSIVQNINRINLSVEETTNAIFTAAKTLDKNITEQQIKEKAKQIHNKGIQIDKDFKNLIERLGYSANHVYQLFQVKVQLTENVTKKADDINLSLRHRVLLTKKSLKITEEDKKDENKNIYDMKEQRQLNLMEKIRDQPIRLAQETINSFVNYYERSDAEAKNLPNYDEEDIRTRPGYVADTYKPERELPEIVRSPSLKYVDLMAALHEFLRQGTGVQLTKGQAFYKKENIEYTEDYRKAIVDAIIDLDAKALKIELYNASRVIYSLIDLIDAKYPKDLDKYK